MNRGVSGDKILGIYNRWYEDALELKPDVISILIGTNDIAIETTVKTGMMAKRYHQILNMLVEETWSHCRRFN